MLPLNVYRRGNADNPAMLFLHGFMGSSRDWSPVFALMPGDYYFLAFDLPGHGESVYLYKDGDYDFKDAASLIMHTLDGLSVDQATLVGYSLGGRLAMYLAARYPQRFTRLIVESASPGLETEKERAQRRDKDARTAEYLVDKDQNAFLESWYTQPLFGELLHHPQYSDMLAQRVLNEPEELARALRGMGQGMQPSLWNELSGLNMPGLFIAGEQDEKYSKLMQRVGENNPNFDVKIIQDAGHNVHFTRPQVFVQTIIEFINTGS